MWLPFTRRSARALAAPSRPCSTSPTQGPAALTMARAATVYVAPAASSRISARQALPSRVALNEAMADADVGAALRGILGVQDDEAAVVRRAIGVGEAEPERRRSGRPYGDSAKCTLSEGPSVLRRPIQS